MSKHRTQITERIGPLAGRIVRLIKPTVAIVRAPEGTIMRIVRMGKSYGVETNVCPHCGLQARLSRVSRNDFTEVTE